MYVQLSILPTNILTIRPTQEDTLKKICDMIKTESENNFQIFEVLDVGNGSNEKSNKNKITAFINNKSNISKVIRNG